MRILVTGATGFLGFHLCQRLIGSGHQVTAFHRKQSQTAPIQALGVRLIQGELGDPEGLCRAVTGHDAVIHAAADIRHWSMQRGLTEQVNAAGTHNVAESCRRANVPRLVYVSSTAAIGIPPDPHHPADETFQFNLENSVLEYHVSKKHGEDAVLTEVANGLDAVIVNPASIFGPHRSGYRGAEMIRKVSGGILTPYFTGGICAVHVTDVVDGTLAALNKGIRGNRYILGGENLSFQQIARRSMEALGVRRPMVPLPPAVTGFLALAMPPLGRLQKRMPRFTPAVHYLSSRFQYYVSDKASRELGYTPRGFDAIVRECLASSARGKPK